METGLGAEAGAQQWEETERGGGKTAVGQQVGGVFWEVVGATRPFPEDPVGIGLLGLACESGDRVPRCGLTCLCHLARVYWWFPALVPAG